MLAGLLAVALLSFAYALLPLYWLPRVAGARSVRKKEDTGGDIPLEFYPVALALILIGFSASLAPPLILVNLFREALGGGLFEVSLYEAVAAITMVAFSLPLLRVRKELGRYMVVLGLASFARQTLP